MIVEYRGCHEIIVVRDQNPSPIRSDLRPDEVILQWKIRR